MALTCCHQCFAAQPVCRPCGPCATETKVLCFAVVQTHTLLLCHHDPSAVID